MDDGIWISLVLEVKKYYSSFETFLFLPLKNVQIILS